MKVFELRKKKGVKSPIYAIALVKEPAIKVGYIALSEGKMLVKLSVDVEKQMVYSPVLIPDQKIIRFDPTNKEPYYIFFSAETIEEAANDFISAKFVDQFNDEHTAVELSGISVVQSWVSKDSKNGDAAALGFDLPKGTWFIGAKITNQDLWAQIKNGTYKGISIEGIFDEYENVNLNKMSKPKTTAATLLSSLKNAYRIALGAVKLAEAKMLDGTTLYTEGEWGEGVIAFTDAELQNVADAGVYELENGQLLTIVEGGVFASLMEKEKEVAEDFSEVIPEMVKTITEQSKVITELKKQVSAHATLLSKVKSEPKPAAQVKLGAEGNTAVELKNLNKFN